MIPIVMDGLTYFAILFIFTSGLTLYWGTLKIINFAHGAFLAMGSFIGYSFFRFSHFQGNFILLALSPIIAGLLVGIIGVLIERFAIRRLYGIGGLEPVYQILLTFAFIYIFLDIETIVWIERTAVAGSVSAPYLMQGLGTIQILGESYPLYKIVLIFIGILFAVLLEYFIHRTNYGKIIIASSTDTLASQTLGINVRGVYTTVFFIGAFFAGLGGALLHPITAAYPGIGTNWLIIGLAVLIVGGVGSIKGAFVAALIIGMVKSFGINYFPQFDLAIVFIIMVIVLSVRKRGLMGREV